MEGRPHWLWRKPLLMSGSGCLNPFAVLLARSTASQPLRERGCSAAHACIVARERERARLRVNSFLTSPSFHVRLAAVKARHARW